MIRLLALSRMVFVKIDINRSGCHAQGQNAHMTGSPLTLVCFAIKEEARPFQDQLRERSEVKTLVTGMGPLNAEKGIRAALPAQRPGLVLTCGFAGGLKPDLPAHTLVFAADGQPALES